MPQTSCGLLERNQNDTLSYQNIFRLCSLWRVHLHDAFRHKRQCNLFQHDPRFKRIQSHVAHLQKINLKQTGAQAPIKGQNKMKQKIITTLIECVLAIVIFGGWGVLLAWRG
jgi:hypothetical protein